tara:strand:- start:13134 stop:13658 length:525 start_codon:yes stop_codon:yes gene_type:complete
MKLLNLTLLLTILTLNTACEFVTENNSGSSKSGEKKLQVLAKEMQHSDLECPTLEGQYVAVLSTDEYGRAMEYTIFYATTALNEAGEMILTLEDGMELLVNGKMNSVALGSGDAKYIAGCSNGILKIVAAQGRKFMTTTYEIDGITLYYKSNGNGPDGSFDDEFTAELDNNFQD